MFTKLTNMIGEIKYALYGFILQALTCSVECYWQCSDETVHYKSDKTVNFCGFRCATTSPITFFINFVFTALHVMQTRYSDENSVCPSVRPSVRHTRDPVTPSEKSSSNANRKSNTRDPWQNGRKIGPDLYTIRKNIYPSFLRRRIVGGGRLLLREILGQPTPVGAKSPIFNN